MLVYTKCNEKRIHLVYYAIHVIMLRNTIYFFDFDDKRKHEDQFSKIVFLYIQICGVFSLQIFQNLIQKSKILNFFSTLLTSTLITIGLYIIPVEFEGSLVEMAGKIASDSKTMPQFLCIITTLASQLLFIHYLMKVSQKGILVAWYEAKTVQKEFEFILSQLEEAIFTKSHNNMDVIAY